MNARHYASLLTTAAFTLPLPGLTQTATADHSAHAAHAASSPARPAANAAAATTEGEVRKVDKANARLTLAHGEIRNLSMPGMTMAFGVKDKAWLDKVKVGDKVRFTAANEGGKLVITSLEAAR